MDEQTAKENTDDSSIKPVSSLRSHFEKMAGPKPSSNTVSRDGSPGARPKDNTEDSYSRMDGRTSLDLPIRDKVWVPQRGRSVVDESSQGGLRPPMAMPTARHRSPGASSRQRPISMGPLSPPRTPPVVKVESPRSPPKPLNFNIPGNSFSRPLGNGLTTPLDFGSQGPGNFPGRQFKIPSRPNSPKPDFSTPSSTDPIKQLTLGSRPGLPGNERLGIDQARPRSFYANQPEKPYLNERAYSPKRFPGGPPPINRAEKPKIPSKPPTMTTQGEGMNLGPVSASDSRVSPFSTPPGSDEEPSEGESSDVRKGRSSKSSTPGSARPRHRNFDPPLANRPISETRSSQRERPPVLRSGTSVTTSKQSIEVQRISTTSGDFEEDRPNLPPRREISSIEKQSTTRVMVPSSQTPRDFSSSTSSPVTDSLNVNFPPPPKRGGTATINVTATTRDARNQTSNRVYSSTSTLSTAVSTEKLDGHRTYIDEADEIVAGGPDVSRAGLSDYPDSSQANRRMPCFKNGPREIQVKYDTRIFDVCGQYLCASGQFTRVWNLLTGELLMSISHSEGVKVTALAFKPAGNIQDEGSQLWLGTNYGEIQELDIPSERVVKTKTSAHPRREVIKILRHANEMWTLDDEGKLHVWPADDSGSPNLRNTHYTFRVPKGHACSLVVDHQLWIASGKDIRVFQPSSDPKVSFNILARPMYQPSLNDITSGAIVSSQPDRVFFGHADGKVSIYSREDYSCLNVVNVSLYKINSMSGVGEYLWAAFNTGMIYVYDTSFKPWKVKKDWHAHDNPVMDILVDRSSILKIDRLQVLSLGTENAIKVWDGMLREDWIEAEMQEHDVDFCEFRELDGLVLTWNAGASKPQDLLNDRRDSDFIRDLLQGNEPYASDILVFGFQELVDLEDKKVTAKSLFKSSKKKESSEAEHMSHQYREWRDYLTRCIEKYSPNEERYYLLHSASLVGLFTCVFIKSSLRGRVRNVSTAEVKRGLGGLHGNKGALIVRFLIDDSSLCFVNCHLAAGQTQTIHRNNDIAGILEAVALPAERDANVRSAIFVGGGDGTMILDHEICILNGDLNYRIDTMGRDTVINAVKANDLAKLLDRDQLLLSRRKNPGFRLRAFEERPITFPPTYKYDVGTDNYDSSEKRRAPAWCDRILYRGIGRIKQLDYRRHEVHASDHRPVSGSFKFRVKTIIPEKRASAWERSERKFEAVKQKTAAEAKLDFLINVCGLNINDARLLLREQDVSHASSSLGK